MKILNITYNKQLGGLEQSFIDYSLALTSLNHDVICLISNNTEFEKLLENRVSKIYKISFLSTNIFKFFLKYQIKEIIQNEKPDVVLLHNGRNIDVIKCGAKNICPLIVVNHGGSIKNILQADGIIAVNNAIKNKIIQQGFSPEKIFTIGNML
jgi:hypothetical protein